jgi:hypothetical protein
MCGDIYLNEVVLIKFGTEALLVYDQLCYGSIEDCMVMFVHKTLCNAAEQN